MLRPLAVFAIVSTLHFVLSVTGFAFMLPAAFETQGGAGFWAAPGKSLLAWMGAVLLAPLALFPGRGDFGFAEIGALSVLVGASAAGIYLLWRK
jgi:hypothetical protein